jgi:hypothetical protein
MEWASFNCIRGLHRTFDINYPQLDLSNFQIQRWLCILHVRYFRHDLLLIRYRQFLLSMELITLKTLRGSSNFKIRFSFRWCKNENALSVSLRVDILFTKDLICVPYSSHWKFYLPATSYYVVKFGLHLLHRCDLAPLIEVQKPYWNNERIHRRFFFFYCGSICCIKK